MPRQYEAIRDKLIEQGYSEEEAKRKAAKIYIGLGKTPEERSKRAKQLAKDRNK